MVKKGEKVFFGWILLLSITVFFVQILLLFFREDTAIFNQTYQEGRGEIGSLKKTASLSLETLQSEPGVYVMVNGEKRGNFYNKKITISVQENSFVFVDTEGVNHPVSVEITGISDFINRENLAVKWEGCGKKFLVGQILFQ